MDRHADGAGAADAGERGPRRGGAPLEARAACGPRRGCCRWKRGRRGPRYAVLPLEARGGAARDAGGAAGSAGAEPTLATKYPGDVGLATDPDVVWAEGFEEGSVATMLARYDDAHADGITFEADVPAKSAGKASAKLTASGAGPNAVDFFKQLSPGYDELYVRYYAKYQAGAPWHHTGVWFGGYNPSTKYANPQAGLKPNGDDRFSVSLEPQEQGPTPRMDFYNYWMQMHSWMDVPMGDTAYYGNA